MILLSLFLITMAFLINLLIRNMRVYRYTMKLLDIVSELAQKDITAGRPWRWRYAEFEKANTYNKMLLQFWKPLDKFFDLETILKEPDDKTIS